METINQIDENIKSLTQIIEEVAVDICNNFCKYGATTDENCECEQLRNGKPCPLDRLM